jgi:hypothetical protein
MANEIGLQVKSFGDVFCLCHISCQETSEIHLVVTTLSVNNLHDADLGYCLNVQILMLLYIYIYFSASTTESINFVLILVVS